MGLFEHYISVGQKRLRCGYTTGTCATAAAVGCVEQLLSGQWPSVVRIDTPAGIPVDVELEDCQIGEDWVSCGVRKDGGDDIDATHGSLVYAKVSRLTTGEIEIDGGLGVGRVTRAGLDQPVGAAAINSTPRRMIRESIEKRREFYQNSDGFSVVISIPEGVTIAKKTFNPRLGIVGGISVLGTSGIVRPMSETALIESVKLELSMLRAAGAEDIVLSPGNYGEEFTQNTLKLSLKHWALCSNYLGEALDHCVYLGFRSVLLVGHLGKLCKVASGNMNTHSKVSDGRRETLTAHGAICGADKETVQALFHSITTEEAVDILDRADLRKPVMESIAQALGEQLQHRGGDMEVEALFFTRTHGKLGETAGAAQLALLHQNREGEQV